MRKPREYGGLQILVKNRLLVRNPKEAVSATEWSRRGYRVRRGEQPHAWVSGRFGGRHQEWAVFRHDQVEPKCKVAQRPATRIDILAAVWVINRRAKRCGKLATTYYGAGQHGLAANAKAQKKELYDVKGRALHYLLAEGKLTVSGYHRFPAGNWAEVLCGGAYIFHRPCPEQPEDAGTRIEDIEAKPRGLNEPRLKDARLTLRDYLAGKPVVDLFRWEPRTRNERYHRFDDVEHDDDDAVDLRESRRMMRELKGFP